MTALIPGFLPPSRENWELIVKGFSLFPFFTPVQLLTDFYPQGKTSINSRWNLPGRWAWFLMEIPGMTCVIYCMLTIPKQEGLAVLPWGNWTMAGLFTIHYIYRAILSPLLLNPSMSPIHPTVFIAAFLWQVANGLSIGGWLGGYGPRTMSDWSGRLYEIEIGMVIWGWSFLGNIFHDDDLREIRRSVLRRQKEQAQKDNKPIEGVEKVYMVPKNGLFHYILFPHYLCEWVEWAAFWMIGGWTCVPARSFLFNEIATMLPRAVQGKRWYIEKFGKEKIGNRKAVIPGLL
ncbi:3-oxo-5-alpha-steroid 4-dehydrogenase [Polychaeton citri CBS 116435]|uniref:3-oxo-5-alpha-steroid 4-dehydrogenase n=1 Tax=Polychaeton citri CBS 116435 TaxID=1314669 RepID=A0A9P4QA75_9PEZI|nr:3-oxo-5-alpha-steroid 4-dehydrogenase [Polychaeton citri CBS 116435]